jgi:hypothetical protein
MQLKQSVLKCCSINQRRGIVMWNIIISVIFYSIILPTWHTGLRATRRTSRHSASVIVRKPLDLPPAVDRAFVEDMKAFFGEENEKAPDDAGALR